MRSMFSVLASDDFGQFCDHSWDMTWSGFGDYLFPGGLIVFCVFAVIAFICSIVIRLFSGEDYKRFIIFPRSKDFYIVLIIVSFVFVGIMYRLKCQIEGM